ncbi:MAG: DUF1156 domain-containing protein [Magnetococcales bacterium]|nr:DUF1156 domain-containing protein [Magnetococcales bacterium]
MTDSPRLIEHAFPLKQTSLDSVHEKNVRHGHISTLHIWPARRPLAACRAALLATLLPDPGTPEGRMELCEKIGGKVVEKIERKKMPGGRIVERVKEETVGGILHWHRERENAETLEWLCQEIRRAYGGRAPRVLDPFSGGGAIPLEALRLGCEVTAADINPVAWFILKCTLEYPQRLAGHTLPLPEFILRDESFMRDFLKVHGMEGHKVTMILERLGHQRKAPKTFDDFWTEGATANTVETAPTAKKITSRNAQAAKAAAAECSLATIPEADLAWHVRAWSRWVLAEARQELSPFYPTYADFEPLSLVTPKPYEKQEMRLVPLRQDATPDIEALNAEFSPEYLKDKNNPRWIAKPTVAYLWARTVPCKHCRALVPLLKTRWLCKKENKRILLTMEPNQNKSGVVFGVQTALPAKGGNTAQRREYDKRLGAGTMSKAGVKCPCCMDTIMTMADIRLEGVSGNLGSINTAVVVEGRHGKEYRLPTELEIEMAQKAHEVGEAVFQLIPFGKPTEPLPSKEALGFRVPLYGFDQWGKLFNHRQLLSMGVLTRILRRFWSEAFVFDATWREGVAAYLALLIDKVADYNSTICMWHNSGEKIGHTFARFAIPMTWDYAESATINDVGGSLWAHADWVARFVEHVLLIRNPVPPDVLCGSAIGTAMEGLDAIITDPPYYDAIPYSDAMDFFHVWLRRGLSGLSPEFDQAFANPLAPKWDKESNDGELIDDASRHDNDGKASKHAYEEGMSRAFQACHKALNPAGRLVVVFAHKHPDAWETLVFAIIQAGFIVDGSWPIQTEMGNRMRAMSSAALASSVWLVCKKRPLTAKAGWDNQVMKSMRENIALRLREFWDAGIRGPDFVWAATGPALEVYSRHPIVKKANDPGQIMAVGEFLTLVRRMVVDFVVGRVLTGDREGSGLATERMDAITAYYLLHRHDFGIAEAPIGACILYATACGLSDRDLEANWQILVRAKGKADLDGNGQEEDDPLDDDLAENEEKLESGNLVKLRPWSLRKHRSMGYEAPGGQPVPLIDRIHRLMHLWQEGDVNKLDQYLDEHGLRRQELFRRLLQSLIELAPQGSEERSLLERISNHIGSLGAVDDRQKTLSLDHPE